MCTVTNESFPAIRVFGLLLLGGALLGSFPAAAANIPPGGLAVTPSGNDLTLSFDAASPKYYVVQASPDLVRWTNCQSGIPGDGTIKTVAVSNAIAGGQGFYRLLIESPMSLVLPQAAAFSILGYDCGGIKEQVTAGIGTNGYPTGVVNMSTSCSTGKAGSPPSVHTASAAVIWDLAGNVISVTPLTNGVTVGPTTPTDGLGDVIYGANGVAYLVVPVPAAPTGVAAVQSGDQFEVSWTPNGVNPIAIASSTLTATPVNSTASILTVAVTGPATSGIIPALQPQTTYQITVANSSIGGVGPTSSPISVTTSPATILPSAPPGVTASWPSGDPSGTTDTITVNWQPANPGNSPVDQYLISITGSDGAGTFTQTVSGTILTAYLTVDFIPNWSVTVQAHNAAGWGSASSPVVLGGL